METFYEVSQILDSRQTHLGQQYLVKWVGYTEEEATWEPLANLTSVQTLIDEYEQGKQAEQAQQRSSRRTRANNRETASPREDSQEFTENSEGESHMQLRRSNRKRKAPCYRELDEDEIPLRPIPTALSKVLLTETTPPKPQFAPPAPKIESSDIDSDSSGRESSVHSNSQTQAKTPSLNSSSKSHSDSPRSSSSKSNDSEGDIDESESSPHSEAIAPYVYISVDPPNPPREIEILDARKTNAGGEIFYKVKLKDGIVEMTHEEVRRQHPVDLCLFFEKHIRFSNVN